MTTTDPQPPAQITAYLFGPFRLRIAGRILERDGKRIQLTPKVVDTLFVLVERAPEVVTKEELMAAVWPDVTVVESGLTRNISALRKALEEDSDSEGGAFLETIPRRGYRFIAPVTVEAATLNPTTGSISTSAVADAVASAVAAAQPETPSPVVTSRSGLQSPILAVLAVSVLLLLGFAVWRFWPLASPTQTAAAVEPEARIGEHLLYKLAPAETLRAIQYFERAIASNPKSGSAHAGLSISLLHQATLGLAGIADVLPRAEQSARRAMELAPEAAVAHYAVGNVLLFKDWNYPGAEAAFKRALELDPGAAQTRIGFVRLHHALGQPRLAQQVLEEALRIDPASPPLGVEYCRSFYYQRDFRRAEAECRKVLDREPGYSLAYYYLALSLGSLGQTREARTLLERTGLVPGVLEADFAWLAAIEGDPKPATVALERRRELIRQGKVAVSAKLLLATVLDRKEEAIEALEGGIRGHAPEMLSILVEPRLAPLREHPGFRAARAKMGLPAAP